MTAGKRLNCHVCWLIYFSKTFIDIIVFGSQANSSTQSIVKVIGLDVYQQKKARIDEIEKKFISR